MIRMNITLPEDVAEDLAQVKNKSRFIADAVKEKVKREKMNKLKKLMIEGYSAVREEDVELTADWDRLLGEGLD